MPTLAPKTLSKPWASLLEAEFQKPYFQNIIKSYNAALKKGEVIYPPKELTFNAFNLTPPQNVKIVILGQDPYHGSFFSGGYEIPQAMGLSFSVPPNAPLPPSLKNIYKELSLSLHIKAPPNGDLSEWGRRGVLLLNSIFSVQKGMASSHKSFGWEYFSDAVISTLSSHFSGIVFMLWGNYAKQKAHLIDSAKHAIITAPHPSPLARGFVGSGVFVRANEALIKMGKPPFDWEI